jgi:hypothetical protein
MNYVVHTLFLFEKNLLALFIFFFKIFDNILVDYRINASGNIVKRVRLEE